MLNNNITSLFRSLNNSSSSIDFTAYSSIKSGSYKKLLKAYYAKDDNQDVKKAASTAKKTKSPVAETTEANKLVSQAKSLKDSAAKLADKDLWKEGEDSRNSIISGVKQFVSDYNDVISQSSKVKSSDVSKSSNWMKSLTGVMSNTLGRAGIKVGTDGTLSVDEDRMKKADLASIKSLFTGNHSYADEIANDASAIAGAASRSNSLYRANGTMINPVSNFFDQGF